MAKKRTPRPQPAKPAPVVAEARSSITAERFSRLYRLVRYLATGAKTREQLTRHLRLDVRGFYRDLEALRAAGILVALAEGRYGLLGPLDDVLARLPFPDAHLNLGEARQLAKGRTSAHRYLREQIARAVT